jgi:hypothetical protein
MTTRTLAAVTHGANVSSPPTLMYAAGVEAGAHSPAPTHGRRLTVLGCALPELFDVVSTQCVGTRPPVGLRNCTVAQPRSLHGRLPRFQIPSATTKLPAAPPPSACEYAICKCELAQVGSPPVTIAGVGEGVGTAVGKAVGTAVGSGEGAVGDGVLGGGLDVGRTGAALEHDATTADRTAARNTRGQRPRSDTAAANELCRGSDIFDAVTRFA